MKSFLPSRNGHCQTPRMLVVLLCLLLVALVGATQVLHIHASNEPANPGCSLCAIAHVTALPAPVLAGPVLAKIEVQVAEPETVSAPQRFFSFSLYVRPPPATTTHS